MPRQDARALAEAVRTLLDDPTRRAALGDKARARVEARYSLSRFCQGVEDVYEELLAARDQLSKRAPACGSLEADERPSTRLKFKILS